MQNLQDVLKFIKKRPGMYLGNSPNLPKLRDFILGYETAVFIHQINEPKFNCQFSTFVARQLGYGESTAGFVNMILAYVIGFEPKQIDWDTFLQQSISDDEHQKAFDLFFELVEEFWTQV
ncbi:MAG: hypothetical protein Q4C98_05585 [Capnocytophaga sp.]|nr:hypothetical protein [Capnocytophaga sp.]